MWLPFLRENDNYMLKTEEHPRKICLTNLKDLWVCSAPNDEILLRFNESNSCFIAEDEETLHEITKAIGNPENIETLELVENDYVIKFKWRISELPVSIEFNLRRTQPEIEVTLPLIKTVQFLELKKKKMSDLLTKKDDEILYYNCQYGDISNKVKVTEKFKEEKVDPVDGLLLNVFTKTDSFCETLVKNHGDIQKDFPELKVEEKKSKRKLKLPSALKKKRIN